MSSARIDRGKPCPSINQWSRAWTDHLQSTFFNWAWGQARQLTGLSSFERKNWLLWNLNVGNLNREYFFKGKICEINLKISTIRFSGKLFISESMCHENHQLAYKCHQLKNAGKIPFTWFCNNAVNIKLSEISNPVKIFNIIDTENFLALTVWMILLVTLHFNWSHLLLCCFFYIFFP